MTRCALFLGTIYALSVQPTAALQASFPQQVGNVWGPYLEWSVQNSTYSGNPFDIAATVTFSHSGGEVRTTEMFYVGDDTWSFRFTGTQAGDWSFATASLDPELDGLTGTVVMNDPEPGARGFVIQDGNKWAVEGVGPIMLNFVMYGTPDYFFDNPTVVDAAIEEFIEGHGFTGIQFLVTCRWFELDSPASDQLGSDPDPDFRTFEALELMITKVHAAGGVAHIWAWGDEQRKWTPVKWGLNGAVDRRLQRYIAARLGPLPGWTMGYGFDLDEWVTEAQLHDWNQFMQDHMGWHHFLGGRAAGPNSGTGHAAFASWNDPMEYSSYEEHSPTYEVYSSALDASPDQPVISEDRFRIRTWITPPSPKDYDLEKTRRGLWASAMAGGVAGIYGNLEYTDPVEQQAAQDGFIPSLPYPNRDELKTFFTFWQARFLPGLQHDATLSNGLALRGATTHFIFYRTDADSIDLDLSLAGVSLSAVAVDAKAHYQEIDLGLLSPEAQTWQAPYVSDWAVAIGFDPDTEPPAEPTGLVTTLVPPLDIELDWDDNTEPDLAGYNVYRGTQSGFLVDAGHLVATNVSVSQYNDPGLTASTTYYYRVSAVDVSGNESAPSLETNATTGATAPASQTLNPIADTFVQKDNASSHGSESRLLAKQVSGTARRYTYIKFDISSVTEPVVEATLRLTSFTSDSWPNPTTVELREFADSSWDESIHWNTRPSDAAMGATLGSLAVPQFTEIVWEIDVTDYVEAARQAGASLVSFTVRGTVNTNGGLEMWSRESSSPPELAVDSFRDTIPPAAPGNPTAIALSTSAIDLVWADNSEPDLSGYDVHRSTVQGFAVAPSNRIATGLTASQFTDTGLSASTTYYYKVVAVDAAGNESVASAEASATTDAPDTTPPAAATGLTVTANGSSRIDLDWDDNTESDLNGYDVYRGDQAGFTPDAASRIASGLVSSQYSDLDLTPETTYYYRVTASDTSGNESLPSAEASATTEAVPPIVTLTPIADTYVKKDDLSSHANLDRVLVKLASGSTTRYTYIKFDTSSVSGPVVQATLRLTAFTSDSWPNPATVELREFADSSWDESIHWNTRPSDAAMGNTLGSLAVPQFTEIVWEIDVTDYVEAARAAGNEVMSFTLRSTTQTNGGLEIWSRESSTPPELVINVN